MCLLPKITLICCIVCLFAPVFLYVCQDSSLCTSSFSSDQLQKKKNFIVIVQTTMERLLCRWPVLHGAVGSFGFIQVSPVVFCSPCWCSWVFDCLCLVAERPCRQFPTHHHCQEQMTVILKITNMQIRPKILLRASCYWGYLKARLDFLSRTFFLFSISLSVQANWPSSVSATATVSRDVGRRLGSVSGETGGGEW